MDSLNKRTRQKCALDIRVRARRGGGHSKRLEVTKFVTTSTSGSVDIRLLPRKGFSVSSILIVGVQNILWHFMSELRPKEPQTFTTRERHVTSLWENEKSASAKLA